MVKFVLFCAVMLNVIIVLCCVIMLTCVAILRVTVVSHVMLNIIIQCVIVLSNGISECHYSG